MYVSTIDDGDDNYDDDGDDDADGLFMLVAFSSQRAKAYGCLV